jgi:hypothetical protein
MRTDDQRESTSKASSNRTEINAARIASMTDRRRYFIHVALNCFRDNADRDYAHARLAYQALLGNQFLWSALHCLEKYAKCICLLNEVSSKDISHEVLRAIKKVQAERKDLNIILCPEVIEFIRSLEQSGARERYMGVGFVATPEDLSMLDMSVFNIREFCFPRLTDEELALDEQMRSDSQVPPQHKRPYSGWLERVIHTPSDKAHSAISWNNAQLGGSIMGCADMPFGNWMFAQSPLSTGTPELLEELAGLIRIPKEVREVCLREIAGQD